MNKELPPAYLRGLSARNRLTDARDAVYRLLDVCAVQRHHDPPVFSNIVTPCEVD